MSIEPGLVDTAEDALGINNDKLTALSEKTLSDTKRLSGKLTRVSDSAASADDSTLSIADTSGQATGSDDVGSKDNTEQEKLGND